MANRWAIALCPRPANCGKMNHIPVALLLTASQVGKDPRVHGFLRIYEPLEFEGYGHGARLALGWSTNSASWSRSRCNASFHLSAAFEGVASYAPVAEVAFDGECNHPL